MPVGRKSGEDWVSRLDRPDFEKTFARIFDNINAGDSEYTAVCAEGIPWPTWSTWKHTQPGLLDRLVTARALGNQRLRAELLLEENPVRAKVRLHLLACRDAEWRAEKRVHISGSIGMAEALATPVVPDAPGGDVA